MAKPQAINLGNIAKVPEICDLVGSPGGEKGSRVTLPKERQAPSRLESGQQYRLVRRTKTKG